MQQPKQQQKKQSGTYDLVSLMSRYDVCALRMLRKRSHVLLCVWALRKAKKSARRLH